MDEVRAGNVAAVKMRRLGVAGFILAIIVLVGATVSVNVVLNNSISLAGAAIDNQDASVLNPAEQIVLQGRSAAIAWINLIGTTLGVTSLVIGLRTRRTSGFAHFTIFASLLAPVLCFIPSVWILSAAATPQ